MRDLEKVPYRNPKLGASLHLREHFSYFTKLFQSQLTRCCKEIACADVSPELNATCRCLFGAFAPVLWHFIEVDQIHPKIPKFPTDCSKCRIATAKAAALMSSYGSSSYPSSFFIALQTYPGDHKNGYSTETVCFQVRGETKYSQIIFRHKSHKRIVQPAFPDLNWQQHLLVSLTWDELIDDFYFCQ